MSVFQKYQEKLAPGKDQEKKSVTGQPTHSKLFRIWQKSNHLRYFWLGG
jgi:hypothetical protein